MARRAIPTAEESPFNILEDFPRNPNGQTKSRQPGNEDNLSDDSAETSDDSRDSTESQADANRALVDDLTKFEESFKGITTRFKLISRIGEGRSRVFSRVLV